MTLPVYVILDLIGSKYLKNSRTQPDRVSQCKSGVLSVTMTHFSHHKWPVQGGQILYTKDWYTIL